MSNRPKAKNIDKHPKKLFRYDYLFGHINPRPINQCFREGLDGGLLFYIAWLEEQRDKNFDECEFDLESDLELVESMIDYYTTRPGCIDENK
jgi:hypothetical protein